MRLPPYVGCLAHADQLGRALLPIGPYRCTPVWQSQQRRSFTWHSHALFRPLQRCNRGSVTRGVREKFHQCFTANKIGMSGRGCGWLEPSTFASLQMPGKPRLPIAPQRKRETSRQRPSFASRDGPVVQGGWRAQLALRRRNNCERSAAVLPALCRRSGYASRSSFFGDCPSSAAESIAAGHR